MTKVAAAIKKTLPIKWRADRRSLKTTETAAEAKKTRFLFQNQGRISKQERPAPPKSIPAKRRRQKRSGNNRY